uniref:IS3 family transposase n=1 Tax=Roseivirga sp. TaxID=1964215 RepID=UPI004048478C
MNVSEACQLLGYTKQAYYKKIKIAENRALREYLTVELIREKRKIWKQGSGRNLLACLRPELNAHGIKIGRDKFFDLLGRHNLLIKYKSKRAITTNSYHFYKRYPNLIKDTIPNKANQIWVSDITYVWTRQEEKFLYLFLITDMYSRKIVGYCISKSLKAKGAVKALKKALIQMEQTGIESLTHHSDRGIQYCCHQYTGVLKANNVSISMTENSDPLENAIAERVNRTIKQEFNKNYRSGYASIREARTKIKQSIEFYNQLRPHRSIEMLTPNEAHKTEGHLERKWKNYKSFKSLN